MEPTNTFDLDIIPINYDSPQLPAQVRTLRPIVYKDGDSYCCLFGADPQQGVFGCGDSELEAMIDWDNHLTILLSDHLSGDMMTDFLLTSLSQAPNDASPSNRNIDANDFSIEFSYQDISYVGVVRPLNGDSAEGYVINLESANQESHLEIIARPSTSADDDWDFTCKDGDDATKYYDKELLTEIGEAIEKYDIDN